MAKHCQECHTLQFEPAVTTREVPHGKPADAVDGDRGVLRQPRAARACPTASQKAFGVPGEGLLRRVGEPTRGRARERAARSRAARREQVTDGALRGPRLQDLPRGDARRATAGTSRRSAPTTAGCRRRASTTRRTRRRSAPTATTSRSSKMASRRRDADDRDVPRVPRRLAAGRRQGHVELPAVPRLPRRAQSVGSRVHAARATRATGVADAH